MADQPRLQNPYNNQGPPSYTQTKSPTPHGHKGKKVSRAQQAVRGLVGVK